MEDAMPTQQGSLDLLADPVAQQLLQSPIPARLAYTWTDGTPRVVPIWFHWDGSEVVLGSPPDAPKLKALPDGTKVALTIEGDTFPYKVLLIRGSVRTATVDGISPEYEATARRMFGEEQGEAWLENVRAMGSQMVRIAIRPEWVGIIDFESRFPSAIEHAMEHVAPS
jgi:hypothetical protein